MRKAILFLLLTILSGSLVFAGSINDTIKNTQTPYLGEKGGFESLFVNPAGMAGQTDIFNFSVFGSVTVPPGIFDTLDTAEKVSTEVDNGELTAGTAEEIAVILADNLSEAEIDLLLGGTALDGLYGDNLINFDYSTLTPAELVVITAQVDANQEVALSAFDDIAKVYGTGSVKLGTLIAGLGAAVYTSEGVTFSLGNRGVETLATETGLQAGFGLNMGNLALGVSGNLALWTLHENIDLVVNPDIMAAPMGYAYSYGLDVGAQMKVLPGITVGAVLSNLIGSSPVNSDDYTGTTADNLLNGAAPTIDKPYVFSTDLDVGLTWAPKLPGWFKPSLSADYYDFISLFTSDTELTAVEALSHLRLGANLHLLVFDFGAQYYNEYLTLGAGFDLAVFQLYVEAKANQDFSDLGGSVLVKLHF